MHSIFTVMQTCHDVTLYIHCLSTGTSVKPADNSVIQIAHDFSSKAHFTLGVETQVPVNIFIKCY